MQFYIFGFYGFSEEALERLNAVREHSERGDFCRCCDKNGRVRWRNEPVKDAKVLTIALPSVKWLFFWNKKNCDLTRGLPW